MSKKYTVRRWSLLYGVVMIVLMMLVDEMI
jgi:hypothetical protein